MQSIPTINLMAVAHLICVSAFLGLYAAESVIELCAYYGRKDDRAMHEAVARFHFWIDTLVEIPIAIGIVATGIGMALLVDKLTALHLLKIGLVICFGIVALPCVVHVFARYRSLQRNEGEETLMHRSKKVIYHAGLAYVFFLVPVLALGFYLAYQRVLISIYG